MQYHTITHLTLTTQYYTIRYHTGLTMASLVWPNHHPCCPQAASTFSPPTPPHLPPSCCSAGWVRSKCYYSFTCHLIALRFWMNITPPESRTHDLAVIPRIFTLFAVKLGPYISPTQHWRFIGCKRKWNK